MKSLVPLLRHSAWVMASLAITLIAWEVLVPGAVAPFLHLPAILTITIIVMLIFQYQSRSEREANRWITGLSVIFFLVVGALTLASKGISGLVLWLATLLFMLSLIYV